MNRHVYNCACLIGTILCAVGAGIQWSKGMGLIVGGALVIALTLYGAEISRRGARRSDG